MAKRLVLHIGAMKSGTSFIQNVLRQQGPARRARHPVRLRALAAQVLAVQELSDRGGPGQEPITPDGPWQRLVDVVNEWPGTAIISMEFLGPAQGAKIADQGSVRRRRPAGGAHRPRPGALLPAMWTESMQNRGVARWEEFLDAVRTEDRADKPGRWFWKHQRIPAIAPGGPRSWARPLHADHRPARRAHPPACSGTLRRGGLASRGLRHRRPQQTRDRRGLGAGAACRSTSGCAEDAPSRATTTCT